VTRSVGDRGRSGRSGARVRRVLGRSQTQDCAFGVVVSGASTSSSATPGASTRRALQAQFIDRYFAAISRSISTGEPEPFLALSSSDCHNCKVFAKNLTAAYADGGRIEGGSCRVVGTRHVKHAKLGAIWNVDVKFSRERWIDGNGNLTKIVRGGTQHFGIAVAAPKERWVVRELRLR